MPTPNMKDTFVGAKPTGKKQFVVVQGSEWRTSKLDDIAVFGPFDSEQLAEEYQSRVDPDGDFTAICELSSEQMGLQAACSTIEGIRGAGIVDVQTGARSAPCRIIPCIPSCSLTRTGASTTCISSSSSTEHCSRNH